MYLETARSTDKLVIYNNKDQNKNDIWWDDGKSGNSKYYLKNGLNIICTNSSCEIAIKNEAANTCTITFGMPDLVYMADGGINPKLCYRGENTGSGAAMIALLNAINAADPNHEFYYNNIMEGNILIEMNDQIDDDDMSDPHKLYDKNNICNKFVISEIDSDFLSKGITIAKSSKLIR